jgi:hypothetical protein
VSRRRPLAHLLVLALVAALVPIVVVGPSSPAGATPGAPSITTFTTYHSVTTYSPPPGATMLRLDVAGAAGGNSGPTASGTGVGGGAGAHIVADVPIDAALYSVEVGNPGGLDRPPCPFCHYLGGPGAPGGGHGGGASAVSRGDVPMIDPLVLAGGGGGGAASPLDTLTGWGGDAPGVGGRSGGPAIGGGCATACGRPGGDGQGFPGLAAGGTGGDGGGNPGGPAAVFFDGTLLQFVGGNGAAGASSNGGGGGGGGFAGGGGGGSGGFGGIPQTWRTGGGGGGGASYVTGIATNVVSGLAHAPSVTITAFSAYSSITASCVPVAAGGTTTCTAHVTSTASGEVPDGVVTFANPDPTNVIVRFPNGPSCALDESGACSVAAWARPNPVQDAPLAVSYAGDPVNLGSSTTAVLAQTTRPSTTAVVCSPDPVVVHQSVTCTATASDAGPPTPADVTPVGGTFTFSNGMTCRMVLEDHCSVSFVADAVGPLVVEATVSGIAQTPSTGSTTVDVVAAPDGEQSFTTPGVEATYVVPPGVTSVHVRAVGGRGGNLGGVFFTLAGGRGGVVDADVPVVPGQTLYVNVGGVGGDNTGAGGANGGGSSVSPSGGGGGASDVRTCSVPLAQANSCRVVVAGGGGGAGGRPGSLTGPVLVPLTAGADAGADSVRAQYVALGGDHGGTGTPVGGNGTTATGQLSNNGSGGGGYLGGQGGACPAAVAGCGGAGGSSYATALATNPVIGLAQPADLPIVTITPLRAADPTPPAIVEAVSGSQGANGWYTSDVTVTWDVQDPESGIATTSGCDPSTVVTDTSGVTFTCVATNGAGAATTRSVTIARDSTPPVIALASPTSGATYAEGATVPAHYSCNDAGSGVATCAGSIGDGTNLDTAAVGAGSFTVTASDAAGNTATTTVAYSVVFPFTGFFAPVSNAPTVNTMRAGAGAAVSFSLGALRIAPLLEPPSSVAVACPSGAPRAAVSSTIKVPEATFTWNRRLERYEYRWPTVASWRGTCRRLDFTLRDGTVHSLLFQLT